MGALRQIFAAFTVETGEAVRKLTNLNSATDDAKAAFKSLAAAGMGMFTAHAVKAFIASQIEMGSQLNDTSERLGVSVEELQKFQFAAGLSGVSSEQAAAALGFLNKNMGEAIGGSKEASETLSGLGVDLEGVRDGSVSATQLLPQLADKFASLGSDAERTALAMKLFGKSGAGMLPLLKKGREELTSLAGRFDALGGGLSQKFVSAADEAGDEIDILKFGLTSLKSTIGEELLPYVTKAAKWFQGWSASAIRLTKETNIVKESLAVLGGVGTAVAVKQTLHWGRFFGLIPQGNLSILGMSKSLLGFGVAAAGIGAAAFLAEDLKGALEGGDSAIKDFLESTIGIESTKEFLNQFREGWDLSKQSIEGLKEPLAEVGMQIAKVVTSKDFLAFMVFVAKSAAAAASSLVAFGGVVAQIPNMVKGDFSGADKIMSNYADTLFGKRKEGSTDFFGEGGLFGRQASDVYAPGQPRPYEPLPPAMDPTNDPNSPYFYKRDNAPINQTNVTNINVNGASDPNAVGNAVAGQIDDVNKQNQRTLAALRRN